MFRAVFNVKFVLVGSSVQKSSVLVGPGRQADPPSADRRGYNAACYYITEPQTEPSSGEKLPNSAEPNRTRTQRLTYSTTRNPVIQKLIGNVYQHVAALISISLQSSSLNYPKMHVKASVAFSLEEHISKLGSREMNIYL